MDLRQRRRVALRWKDGAAGPGKAALGVRLAAVPARRAAGGRSGGTRRAPRDGAGERPVGREGAVVLRRLERRARGEPPEGAGGRRSTLCLLPEGRHAVLPCGIPRERGALPGRLGDGRAGRRSVGGGRERRPAGGIHGQGGEGSDSRGDRRLRALRSGGTGGRERGGRLARETCRRLEADLFARLADPAAHAGRGVGQRRRLPAWCTRRFHGR